jgi:hypothetical protein
MTRHLLKKPCAARYASPRPDREKDGEQARQRRLHRRALTGPETETGPSPSQPRPRESLSEARFDPADAIITVRS